MGANIRNYYFNKIDARLNNSEYYDFFLTSDEFPLEFWDTIISGDTLIGEFDFNNESMYLGGEYSATTIFSISSWMDAVNTGLTLDNIGLTGLDNGLVPFEKEDWDLTNSALTQTLTGTTMQIPADEFSFILNPVTGYTENFIYPIEILPSPNVGHYAQLCGGFYQGFYKIDNNSYQTLPNRYSKGWTVEFWLNKNDDCNYTGNTLNDLYPDNKGFFFYLGTRAENKFWTIFEGLNTGTTSTCTSGCTDWCTIPKETDIRTTSGYPLSPPPLTIREIDNKFLIYSRACNGTDVCDNCRTSHNIEDTKRPGHLACNFTGDSVTLTATTMETTDFRNKFTFFSRACAGTDWCSCGTPHSGGTMVCNYSGDSQPIYELDCERDLVKTTNAFGLRIKDDGSIGYRAIVFTCITATTLVETTVSSGITVIEDYSYSGLVSDNEWTHVVVKWVADVRYDPCKLQERGPRNGKLMVFVNGRLKHIFRNVEEMIPKRLNEWYQKQEGVPYNISVGGGSQGLLESITFDGQDPDDQGLPIEENFAGTFIGGIARFRLYSEPLNWCEIKNNYEIEGELFGLL